MPRKRGRPRIDDSHRLKKVADRLVRGESPSRHAAMNLVVTEEDRSRSPEEVKHIVRRLDRKWAAESESLMARAEAAFERKRARANHLDHGAGAAAAAGLLGPDQVLLQNLAKGVLGQPDAIRSRLLGLDQADNIIGSFAKADFADGIKSTKAFNDLVEEFTRPSRIAEELLHSGCAQRATEVLEQERRIGELMSQVDPLTGLRRW